jgi:hypothetical protein
MITVPNRLVHFVVRSMVAPVVICLIASFATAAPTGFAPDAWTRANDANTSYFGWDVFESAIPPSFYGALQDLDDSTPDLGSGITATNTRIFQGTDGKNDLTPTANGHMSGSGNYYSFFDTMNDTISGVAPGGAGGYTTVVLQLHSSSGGSLLDDLSFVIDDSQDTWTLHKHLNDTGAGGLGFHWIEWSAPGGSLPFAITMTSTAQHRTIDSFEIDTFWTGAASPAVNAISRVPEPAGVLLMAFGTVACGCCGRRFRRGLL